MGGRHAGAPENPDAVEGNGQKGVEFDALHAQSSQNAVTGNEFEGQRHPEAKVFQAKEKKE